MKNFKILILFFAFVTYSKDGKSQEVKIKPTVYFLADTISVERNNRVMEIGKLPNNGIYYAFFCRCISPYHFYPTFIRNKSFKPELTKDKPNGNYLSWEELANLLRKHGNEFVKQYNFIIVEKLPDRSFQVIEKLHWVDQEPITTLK